MAYSHRAVTCNGYDPLELSPGVFLVTLGSGFVSSLATIVRTWLCVRPCRKVQVKTKDTMIATDNSGEIEKLPKAGSELHSLTHPDPRKYDEFANISNAGLALHRVSNVTGSSSDRSP
jgi:hypothetical protein